FDCEEPREVCVRQRDPADVAVLRRELERLLQRLFASLHLADAPIARAEMRQRRNDPAGLAALVEPLRGLLECGHRLLGLATHLGNVRCTEDAARDRPGARTATKSECALVPLRGLERVAAVPPEAPDRPGQHQRTLPVA